MKGTRGEQGRDGKWAAKRKGAGEAGGSERKRRRGRGSEGESGVEGEMGKGCGKILFKFSRICLNFHKFV